MKQKQFIFLMIASLWLVSVSAFADKLNVVTSSADLEDFVTNIGGDFVSVKSFFRGDVDPTRSNPDRRW
jgi:ABC-type Zn uptake system ZnuABC Zn-binding protein ZnuA